MKKYIFNSDVEDGDSGFFDAQSLEAKTEQAAWDELKLMLTKDEFSTAELLCSEPVGC